MIINGKLAAGGKNVEKKMAKEKFSLFLLWMISKKEQHGYEIIKSLNEDPVMSNAAASKVYPILRGLSKKGLISQKKVMQGKRVRKVYFITPKGKEILKKTKEYVARSRLMMEYMEDLFK
jgi:DNA-binding PadR family transcriptional regulator